MSGMKQFDAGQNLKQMAERTGKTHALVIALYEGDIADRLGPHAVYLYSSEELATLAALRMLEGAGYQFRDFPQGFVGTTDEQQATALDAFQYELQSTEYFHVFPIKGSVQPIADSDVEYLEGTKAADAAGLRDAVLAIGLERLRQHRKGRTDERDDTQTSGELLQCGVLVCLDVLGLELSPLSQTIVSSWPEERAEHIAEKYGDDHIRRLTIAGAMIAAEIDRLQRKKAASA